MSTTKFPSKQFDEKLDKFVFSLSTEDFERCKEKPERMFKGLATHFELKYQFRCDPESEEFRKVYSRLEDWFIFTELCNI